MGPWHVGGAMASRHQMRHSLGPEATGHTISLTHRPPPPHAFIPRQWDGSRGTCVYGPESNVTVCAPHREGAPQAVGQPDRRPHHSAPHPHSTSPGGREAFLFNYSASPCSGDLNCMPTTLHRRGTAGRRLRAHFRFPGTT